jgi:hypothetical protein
MHKMCINVCVMCVDLQAGQMYCDNFKRLEPLKYAFLSAALGRTRLPASK